MHAIKSESEIYQACKQIDWLSENDRENLGNSFWDVDRKKYGFFPHKPFSANAVSVWETDVHKSTKQIIFCGLASTDWSFDEETCPYTLSNAIQVFIEKIGVAPIRWAWTYRLLLKKTVKSGFKKYENQFEYFAPFTEQRVSAPTWKRELTREEKKAKYVHAFDKRAMFLNACSSLRLGENNYEILENICFSEIDKNWCGLCDVEITWTNKQTNLFLQDLIGENTRFFTAFLRFLIKDNYAEKIKIKKAWIFTETHQTLNQFYKIVSKAKKETSDGDAADKLANSAIKKLYVAGTGWLASEKDGYFPEFFRPDWRGEIVSNANANLFRNILQVKQVAGKLPFAIQKDCLFYFSDYKEPFLEFENTHLFDAEKFSFEWTCKAEIIREALPEIRRNIGDLTLIGKENNLNG